MRALLSVSDKTGIIPFARALTASHWELVSTGGTARALTEAGLPVLGISDVTGFPEMMDGRVKTLHPRVHAGILARRHREDDRAALAEHSITPIDLVVVNLYPFAQAAAKPDLAFDHLIEEIDIGGPSLLRAAAKNFHDVLVVVDPGDYASVLAALATPGGPRPAFRFELARRAFAHTAAYDQMIAATLGEVKADETAGTFHRGRTASASSSLPETWQPQLTKLRDLRYGENPHLAGAWYADGRAGFGNATVHQGKELSFTNLLDLDAAARIALEFSEPAAVVIKHTNPCGVATSDSLASAYVRAREADALSAFGGIVGLNRPIDVETAKALASTFIEAVVAPGLTDAAEVLAILAAKPNLRVVTATFDAGVGDRDVRSILGAWLVQTRDRVVEASVAWPPAAGSPAADNVRVSTRRAPTADEWEALRFAWRVCAHVKSNSVIFTGPDQTIAVGAGQMSRVDAVKAAVMKGGDRLRGSVVASDAFFPFRDGLDAVAAAGATAVVQPGGSVRDAEVIAAADEHGLAMVFTGRRHFRH